MSLELLKWIMLGVMAMMTIFFGLLPIKNALLNICSVDYFLVALKANEVIDYLNNTQSSIHKHSSLILSLFSCFAGGVFISVCFLDMLPDSLEAWEDVKTDTGYQSDYPFVQLIALCGFFFVYLTEELSSIICNVGHGHSHSNDPIMDSNVTFPRARLATVGSIFNVEGNLVQPCKRSLQDYDEDGEGPVRQSIIFTSAFILHVFFECFAFGVQEDTVSVTSLFLGIALHKAIVMFSLGMKLTRSHPRRRWIVVILILILAAFNVIGGSCGILIESSNMNQTPKDITTAVLMSFSLGTFIYISFFEMLAPERANNHSNILQWIASVCGFALLAVNMIWA